MRVFFSMIMILVCLPLGAQQNTKAKSGDGGEGVEALYDQLDQKEESKQKRVRSKKPFSDKKFKTLSDLANLNPFDDIAVISRKFLPKTGRFEFSGSGAFSLNNAFFQNLGATLRLGFYFTESWAVEASYYLLTDSERDITKALDEKVNVETRSLVNPSSFYGATLKWMPVYGKFSMVDKVIVPFDMYFTLGLGMTQTGESSGEPTLTIGAGQIFARTKMMAFRWDLNLHLYQATVLNSDGAGGLQEDTLTHNDLFLGVGVSFFFPEAKYR